MNYVIYMTLGSRKEFHVNDSLESYLDIPFFEHEAPFPLADMASRVITYFLAMSSLKLDHKLVRNSPNDRVHDHITKRCGSIASCTF